MQSSVPLTGDSLTPRAALPFAGATGLVGCICGVPGVARCSHFAGSAAEPQNPSDRPDLWTSHLKPNPVPTRRPQCTGPAPTPLTRRAPPRAWRGGSQVCPLANEKLGF